MQSKPNYKELEKYRNMLKAKLAERNSIISDLKESQSLYQALFEHAGVAMLLTDMRTGKVVAFNQKSHDDLQYTAEEFKNLTYQDYMVSEKETYEKNINAIIEKGHHVFESKLKRKDGSIMDVLCSSVVMTIGGNKYIQSIRFDISKQKQVEKKLRESEARYRNILENMEEGYYEVDLAGNLTFFNNAFARMYGYPPEELMGINNRQYMTPETAEKVYRFFNELYRTGKTPSPILDYEVIRKDGSVLTAEISVSMIKDAEGNPTGFKGIVRDGMEKNQLEKALKERENFYRTLFDHAGFGVTLADARTGIRIAYNKMAYEQLGYTSEEYEKTRSREFFCIQ